MTILLCWWFGFLRWASPTDWLGICPVAQVGLELSILLPQLLLLTVGHSWRACISIFSNFEKLGLCFYGLLIFMYIYFARMHVYVPCMCLVLAETRRGLPVRWKLSYICGCDLPHGSWNSTQWSSLHPGLSSPVIKCGMRCLRPP